MCTQEIFQECDNFPFVMHSLSTITKATYQRMHNIEVHAVK